MKYLKFCLLLLFPLFVVANPTPVSQLTHLLGSFTSYQADFQQWTLDDQHQMQSESNGTIEIKRPNKFRWYSKLPNKELIIANGDVVWHYDVDLMQATKQTTSDSSSAQNPAMLLSSRLTHLQQNFTISTVSIQGQNWFLLVPNQKQSYKKIYLYFSQNKLTKIIVINNLGERSLFQFTNIKLNQPIADSQFEFNAPKGVDVNVQQ